MKLIIWFKLFFIFFIYITYVFGELKPNKTSKSRLESVQDCKKFNTNYIMDITTKSGEHVCGGTLITSVNVLTAAHCNVKYVDLHVIDREYRDYYYNPDKGLVLSHLIKVNNTFQHPDYNATTSQNDIAVLKLLSAVRKEVKPIELPPAHLPSKNFPLFCPVATVMAWKKDHLLCGQVAPITLTECNLEFNDLGQKVICSKDNQMCYNDSGTPLTCGDDVQYGVVSQKMECEQGGATAYTKVDFYVEFIKKHLLTNRSSKNHQTTLPVQSITLISILLFSIFVNAIFGNK